MVHTFNIEIAKRLGINPAIFINCLAVWIANNQSNNKNFHEQRFWTYNSSKAYRAHFPYWSQTQIKQIIENLEEENIIQSRAINKVGYANTKWYTIIDIEIMKMYSIGGLVSKKVPVKKSKEETDPQETRIIEFRKSLIPYLEKYGAEIIQEFSEYWTEKSPKGKKMRFEKEKVFDPARRLQTWNNKSDDWNKKNVGSNKILIEVNREREKQEREKTINDTNLKQKQYWCNFAKTLQIEFVSYKSSGKLSNLAWMYVKNLEEIRYIDFLDIDVEIKKEIYAQEQQKAINKKRQELSMKHMEITEKLLNVDSLIGEIKRNCKLIYLSMWFDKIESIDTEKIESLIK